MQKAPMTVVEATAALAVAARRVSARFQGSVSTLSPHLSERRNVFAAHRCRHQTFGGWFMYFRAIPEHKKTPARKARPGTRGRSREDNAARVSEPPHFP